MNAYYIDLLAVVISVSVIVAYYVFLSVRIARNPDFTTHSVN